MADLYEAFASPVGIILAAMVLTFTTRALGAVALSRFDQLPPRVEAGLEAIPPAVLTALVAPAIINGGPPEWIATALAVVLAYRVSLIWVVLLPTFALALMRQLGGL